MLNGSRRIPSHLSAVALAVIAGLAIAVVPARGQMGGGMGHGDGTTGNGSMGKGMGGMMLVSGADPYRADRRLLEMSDAVEIAGRYLAALNLPGLALDEVEEWDFNYYVVVREAPPSEFAAFQLVIDKWSGAVTPEPGPNMMWNTKYRVRHSMMHGMGGSHGGQPMTVTPEAAAAAASRFLGERFPTRGSLAVVSPPDRFYGYYTFDVVDTATGAKFGMLSVNGATATVWYHTWHGGFIQGRELD
jgi:hypothetical protein